MFILQTMAWFIGSCIVMSFVEHTAHRSFMHRRFFLAERIPALNKVFHHHAVLHHGQYREIYSDAPVAPGADRGIRLSLKEGFLEACPVVALIALFSWQGAAIFMFVVLVHHYLWGKIHLEMHKPEGRIYSTWPMYQFLARHHYLHHKYPGKNYNVVFPIADYILGTNVRASESDLQTMRELGFWGKTPRLVPAVELEADNHELTLSHTQSSDKRS